MKKNKVQESSGSATEGIFDVLREDLLSGRYEAGGKLTISSLRNIYHVGLSPLREALSRLSAIGLLEREVQRGFRVPKLLHAELQDIVELRVELERKAVSRALRNGDSVWESEVLAAGHRLKNANSNKLTLAEWEQLHTQFHSVLLSSCESFWMLNFIRQLHEQFDRYRRKAPLNPTIRGLLDMQHEQMVDLALARDEQGIQELIEEHIRLSYEVAVRSCF